MVQGKNKNTPIKYIKESIDNSFKKEIEFILKEKCEIVILKRQ